MSCVYNRLTTKITLKTLMCLEIKADRLGNFEVQEKISSARNAKRV